MPAARTTRSRATEPKLGPVSTELVKHINRVSTVRFIALGSIFAMSAAITSTLVWFVLTTYINQDERIARLAQAITRYGESMHARLQSLETSNLVLDELAADRWKRAHMVRWCLEFERLNKGVTCPSPFTIAPVEVETGAVQRAPAHARSFNPFPPIGQTQDPRQQTAPQEGRIYTETRRSWVEPPPHDDPRRSRQ